MYAYRIARSIALGLRRAQVALLATAFTVSDVAEYLGEKAKRFAHRKLDLTVVKSQRAVNRAWDAVWSAEARAEHMSYDHDDLCDDVAERRRMIEGEVL